MFPSFLSRPAHSVSDRQVAFSGRNSASPSPDPGDGNKNHQDYESYRGYPSSYGRKEYGKKEAKMAEERDGDTASLAEKRRQVRLAASAFENWENHSSHPNYGDAESKLITAVRALKQRLGKK